MTASGRASFVMVALMACAAWGVAQDRPSDAPPRARSRAAARPPAPAPEPPSNPDVAVRTSVDRTAIFVGDRVTYTIELTCRHGTDVLTDDVSRDKLKLDGLDMLGSDVQRDAVSDDQTRYLVRYTLTTYRVDAPTLRIAPLSVRYYIRRSGQRPEEASPAGAVQAPGATIALRSLLPEAEGWHEVRDTRDLAPRPLLFRALQPIGLALIIVAISPVAALALALAARVRRTQAVDAHRSRRQARAETRSLLDAVRATDPATADARRNAFERLDALVREHVANASGIGARSLTPTEIKEGLKASGSQMPLDLVSSLLTECEAARYGPPNLLPDADAWRRALADAEQLLATH